MCNTKKKKMYFLACFIIAIVDLAILCSGDVSGNFSNVDIPREHMPFYFYNFPDIANQCANNENCPYRDIARERKCWGYEASCPKSKGYSTPVCNGDYKGWAKSNEEHVQRFNEQADFGYIKERSREMQIMCEPLFRDDSSLECADHLRFCRGRNIMFNFTDLIDRKEPIRYAMDVLKQGQVGGYCKLHKKRLQDQCDHLSALQSWGPELRNFVELPHRPLENNECDVVIDKPTFILKIDAINMYHHFCDFFNLYAALHLNASHPEMFSRDVHILIWESYSYLSNFAPVMETFTKHPVWDLKTFKGETVCFRNIVFPLLPRMIFGLFYNTPVVYGCEKSGLFHAFSKHILHRMKIPQHQRSNDKIRITLLSRQTKYRRILNEDQLVERLQKNSNYEVQRVYYSHQMPFSEQLELTLNSDVFIGMHGSGLTHLLFLPDWAVLFELYNCEDENCYMDLARLRGVKYLTWQDSTKVHQEDEGHHPQMGAHAKFTNYRFDVDEFETMVKKASDHVQEHPAFKEFLSSSLDPQHSSIHHEL